MLMLGATRPQSVRALRPTSVSVQALVSLGRKPLPSEETMREVEVASASWPAAFVRRTVGSEFVITLDKRDVDAPVPVVRTAWLQTFKDELARDVFFDWLCTRIDRWEAWAKLAWSDSGTRLTSHLLSLVGLSMLDGRPT